MNSLLRFRNRRDLVGQDHPGRSCRTGFIREGVGAISEIIGACPDLLANEFAPTLSKSTRLLDQIHPGRSRRTGFIREDVGAISEIIGACPDLLANEIASAVITQRLNAGHSANASLRKSISACTGRAPWRCCGYTADKANGGVRKSSRTRTSRPSSSAAPTMNSGR